MASLAILKDQNVIYQKELHFNLLKQLLKNTETGKNKDLKKLSNTYKNLSIQNSISNPFAK